MEKVWQNQLDGLVEVLGFKNRPVAITFSNEAVEAGERKRTWLCKALQLATSGKSLVVDRESSACPGGSWHCGFTDRPSGEPFRVLQKFLTKGEKLTHSVLSFHRMQSLTSQPPKDVADFVLIGPIEEAPIMPDLVLFLANGEQACRLLGLDSFWDGIPPEIEVAGSLCHSAIAYPAVTGRTNITFGDWTARRQQKYGENVVFVTVPYERINNLVAAIPECSAGTAELEIPPEMRRAFQEE
jgi:uncharacterized protein (DUF169 family)